MVAARAILAFTGRCFFLSCDADRRNRVHSSVVISTAPLQTRPNCLDFVQVAAGVSADLPYIRFHVAKLFVSMLLLRLGLGSGEVAGFFPGVDPGQLSTEYLKLLDGDRMGAWFLEALDRFEAEVRRCVGLSSAGAAPCGSFLLSPLFYQP